MTEQPMFQLSAREFIKKALLTVSLVLFFNLFLFHGAGPVSFVLKSFSFFLFVAVAFYSRKILFSTFGTLIILLCTFFALLFRANSFTVFIEQICIAVTLLIFIHLASNSIPFVRSLLELIFTPLNGILSYLKSLVNTSFKILPTQLKSFIKVQDEKQKVMISIVIGLCVGFPLVVFLIYMFSQADPIYSSFINKLFQASVVERIGGHVIYSLVLLVFLLPVTLIRRSKAFSSPLQFFSHYSFVHEMTIVMSLIAIVLASFLIIQWPYIFANVPFETHLSQFGVATYSEYVRKGFGELLKIAFFLYGVIWLGLIFLKNKKKGQKTVLPVIQTIVLAEFLLFIVSVFRRIWLYQEYHGWSLIRIYGGFLLLWIAGITLFLAARHFWHKRYVIGEAIFTGILVILFGVFNAEQFIVQTHPPTVNNRIDYTYLARMSSDGYMGWKQAFGYADRVLSQGNFGQKSTIEKDERREIAYAKIVLMQLTRSYHNLLLQYGTDDEIRMYYKDILVFQKKAQESTVDWLFRSRIKSVEALRRQGLDFTNLQEDYDIQRSQNNIESIQKLLSEIDKKDVNLTEIEDLVKFSPQSYGFPMREGMSFYYVNDIGYNPKATRFKKDAWSLFYRWNYSTQQAYRSMKQDMPHQKLFDLQRKYHELYEKIQNQPEDQRGYDSDISLNAPFLESL